MLGSLKHEIIYLIIRAELYVFSHSCFLLIASKMYVLKVILRLGDILFNKRIEIDRNEWKDIYIYIYIYIYLVRNICTRSFGTRSSFADEICGNDRCLLNDRKKRTVKRFYDCRP